MFKNLMFSLKTIAVVAVLSFISISKVNGQCPMCRMTLESNLKNGGSQGSGMNAGIMYLLFTPYILVGGIAYVWYRNRKKRGDMDMDIEDELYSFSEKNSIQQD